MNAAAAAANRTSGKVCRNVFGRNEICTGRNRQQQVVVAVEVPVLNTYQATANHYMVVYPLQF